MSSPPRPDLAHRSDTRAAVLAARLDKPMGALGIVFMLVVLGQTLAGDPALQLALSVSGWILWAVFVGEFGLRLYVAEHRGRFLRHNWWQVLFLALPFLRFVRAVALLRAARAGGVVASAVRGSRSAGRLLTDRLGWLATVTPPASCSTCSACTTTTPTRCTAPRWPRSSASRWSVRRRSPGC
jgi:voltage-gated potassium channel